MHKPIARLTALLAATFFSSSAFAQGVVQQVGPVVPGHPAVWNQNGQIIDSANFPGATIPSTLTPNTWVAPQTFSGGLSGDLTGTLNGFGTSGGSGAQLCPLNATSCTWSGAHTFSLGANFGAAGFAASLTGGHSIYSLSSGVDLKFDGSNLLLDNTAGNFAQLTAGGVLSASGGFSGNLVGTVNGYTPTNAASQPISLWDFLTPTCQQDAINRTEICDDTVAMQNWIAATLTQMRDGYAPAGTYKIAGGSSHNTQIVIDMKNVPSNGPTYFGDNAATTIFDFCGSTAAACTNTANPPFFMEVSGGTPNPPGPQSSETYGSLLGLGIQCNTAGPCLKVGTDNFSDAINQGRFNLQIQNFNTSSSSTCGRFNYVLSAIGYLNCSTAAGPSGGNDAWQFEQVQFGNWTLGGSGATNWLHITNGSTSGNGFFSIDCEIAQVCVKIDSSSAIANAFYSGTWGYTVNGVNATAGTLNAVYTPQVNAGLTPPPFLSAGSSAHISQWDNTTIAPLASPTFSGTVVVSNASANSNLNLVSGSATGQITEDTANNLHINNTAPGGFIVYGQAGSAGVHQWQVNGADMMDLNSGGFTVKTPLVAQNGLTVGSGTVLPNLTGTTGSIGGTSLAAGACSSGTVSVSSAATTMSVVATPVTYPGDGVFWHGYVSAAGTVTVKVCESVAGTPAASAYNVRVLQ